MRRRRNRNVKKEGLSVLPPLMDNSAFELSEVEFDYLLSDLCVQLGCCISPAASRALWESRPATVDQFVDGLLAAEGLTGAGGRLHSSLKQHVQAFIAGRRAH